jgi:import receptor subunit TOM20
MQEVSRGEALSGEGTKIDIEACGSNHHLTINIGTNNIEAALCFYKALKVYPQPSDLITIYGPYSRLQSKLPLTRRIDKTVPKPVLDILAEMIAADSGLKVGPFASGPGSDSGIPNVGLD